MLAKIPARMSSAMIPIPPGTRLSTHRIGKGFNISKTLNNAKPPMMKTGVKGSANRVTDIPQISSTTTCLGSFCPISCSAAWAIHVDSPTSAKMKSSAWLCLIKAIIRHRGKAASDPKVPGAFGEKPIRPPVAKKIIAFCLKTTMDVPSCPTPKTSPCRRSIVQTHHYPAPCHLDLLGFQHAASSFDLPSP